MARKYRITSDKFENEGEMDCCENRMARKYHITSDKFENEREVDCCENAAAGNGQA
jgi:hypothetical protein